LRADRGSVFSESARFLLLRITTEKSAWVR
jgi:hypothetical protein